MGICRDEVLVIMGALADDSADMRILPILGGDGEDENEESEDEEVDS